MIDSKQKTNTLDFVLKKYKQYEVDFLFPDKEKDVPVYLDLYLMYETADEVWNEVHTTIFWYFNKLLNDYKGKKISNSKLIELLHFPEVHELGYGHCVVGTEGAGTAGKRAVLLKETIFDNPDVREVGLSSLAKLAIQIDGFGPDLLSDMTAAFALDNLIKYTSEQVETYGLKTMSVNLQRGFDFRSKEWKPRQKVELPYFDNGECRLLAPRHIVRKMPILSTDEFYRGFLKYVLQNEEISRLQTIGVIGKDLKISIKDLESKIEKDYKSVTLAVKETVAVRPKLVDEYIDNPHRFDNRRRPRKPKVNWSGYIEDIRRVGSGTESSLEYSSVLLKIFKALYGEFLLRGKIESRSYKKTYRYDVNFLNASSTSFFKVLEKAHITAAVLIIEAKNYEKTDVGNKEYNQGLAYTLKNHREFIFLVQRDDVDSSDITRSQQHYLRHGVIIFPLSDSDVIKMIKLRETSEKDFDSVLEERLQSILAA